MEHEIVINDMIKNLKINLVMLSIYQVSLKCVLTGVCEKTNYLEIKIVNKLLCASFNGIIFFHFTNCKISARENKLSKIV